MIFLEQLARKYKTDKLEHGFIDIYDIYLACNQEKTKTVLEIGVDNGNSLKMWNEYFPNAKIIGWDIKAYKLDAFGPRISTFCVDQEDKDSMHQALDFLGAPQFDLIIDDGCHTMEGQQKTLASLWSVLSPGGIYIVEDLHTSLPHNQHEWAGGKCLPDFSNSSLKALESLQTTGKIESIYMTDEEKNLISNECFRCRIHDMKNDERHITAILIKKIGGNCGQ